MTEIEDQRYTRLQNAFSVLSPGQLYLLLLGLNVLDDEQCIDLTYRTEYNWLRQAIIDIIRTHTPFTMGWFDSPSNKS